MEFCLPDIGEGVTEGEISNWLVQVGDQVIEDQPIVDVMTDKATAAIPSPVTGKIEKIVAQVGDTVPVGGVLAIMSIVGEAPAPRTSPATSSTPKQAPKPPVTAVTPSPTPAANSSIDFKLPDIGEGVEDGEIVAWLAQQGDQVVEDQPIVDVMTDKATAAIPSPATGILQEIVAQVGATVPIGGLLARIVTGASASTAAPVAAPSQATSTAPAQSSQRVLDVPPAERPRILAAPRTRALARHFGLDIYSMTGTGKHGRITREDVERASEGLHAVPIKKAPTPTVTAPVSRAATPKQAPKTSPKPVASTAGDERVPIRGIRKKIAEAMHRSKSTAAHFTYVEEVDVTELVALRNELKPIAAEEDVKLTYLPFIVKATVAALKKFPRFNSNVDDANMELVVRGEYNIGIAADTKNGLVVPVLRNADQKGLMEISSEIRRLAFAARDSKLSLSDLKGGTFTITSAGHLGGLFATPIINYPEVAIMGVHKIVERPIVKDGDIVIGRIMYLSISLDHRIIDGADAARFMNHVVKYLENPKLLMLI